MAASLALKLRQANDFMARPLQDAVRAMTSIPPRCPCGEPEGFHAPECEWWFRSEP